MSAAASWLVGVVQCAVRLVVQTRQKSVFTLPLGQQMLSEVVVLQQLVGVLLDART
jgi:hypothetical protein